MKGSLHCYLLTIVTKHVQAIVKSDMGELTYSALMPVNITIEFLFRYNISAVKLFNNTNSPSLGRFYNTYPVRSLIFLHLLDDYFNNFIHYNNNKIIELNRIALRLYERRSY